MPKNKLKLNFGVEIELYVKPTEKTLKELETKEGFTLYLPEDDNDRRWRQQDKNRLIVVELIAEQLRTWLPDARTTRDGIPIDNYAAWNVDEDQSLVEEKKNIWGIELISRILSTGYDWESEVEHIFNSLKQHWTIQEPGSCATHIHVSPFESLYTLGQIKKIMKATWFFDEAFTKTATASSKYNIWCMPNSKSVVVRKPRSPDEDKSWTSFENIRQAYRQIEGHEGTTWNSIFQEINGVTSEMDAFIRMGGTRMVSMNFKHLCYSCRTIEFRRPPGVQSSEDAIYYALFALGFFAEALNTDFAKYEQRTGCPSLKEFSKFVNDGLRKLDGRSRSTDRVRVLTKRPLMEV
ncbi:putative amidoligase enzyme-domain-containing protein [Xylariaceae sp. FL0255]|nr:putative amidoligase enzyme-domain-containing protein [Xylariaceae sp. FL0255]